MRSSLWLALLGACGPSAPPASKETVVPLAEVVVFDCGSSLKHKQGENLRGMKLGGPGGAAWNWDDGDVICVARVSLRCQVKPSVTISAGKHEQVAEVAQVSEAESDVVLARASFKSEQWRAQLQPGDLYATLQLSVRAEGKCAEGDDKAGHAVEASDTFSAGFAAGE